MCISATVSIYFMQQFEDLKPKWDSFRIVVGETKCMFGFPTEYQPQILATRILIAFWFFGGMIFVAYLLTIFMHLSSIRIYDHQIQSIREIVDNTLNLKGDGFVFHHLKTQNEVNVHFEQ